MFCFFVMVVRWVNRKDPSGKNVFSGGFLGLDNIGRKGTQVFSSIGYTLIERFVF